MNLSDEIHKLQQLHQDGALTDEEFAQAKAAVLGGTGQPLASSGRVELELDESSGATSEHLRQIEMQNELARLDREWDMERESFMVTGRYGSRSLPSEGASVAGAVITVLFGGFWTMGAASIGAPGFFLLFGVLFIVVGVASGLNSFSKAGGYKEAHQRYQQRRAQLLSRRSRV